MSTKVMSFFASVRFRIVIVFMLLMLMALELLGAFFVHETEKNDLNVVNRQMILPTNLQQKLIVDLQNKDVQKANQNMQNDLLNYYSALNNELIIVDVTGTIRATNKLSDQQLIGKKTTDINLLSALNHKSYQIYVTQQEKKHYVQRANFVISVEVGRQEQIIGVVQVQTNIDGIYSQMQGMTQLFVLASVIALIVGSALALILTGDLTRALQQIYQQIVAVTGGNYTQGNHIYGLDEVSRLAGAMNKLSYQVEESTESIDAEKKRLDSVLSHMGDGVLAINRRGNVTMINKAASVFLDVDSQDAINMNIINLLRIKDQVTLRELLESPKELKFDLSDEQRDLVVQVYLSLIKRQSGFISGVVILLHDVTEQQKIESERRMFVSNVSHELRTPLTSVRSYVDALADGAIDEPTTARTFLHVIQDETQRMIRMINDLLELSRLDNGTLEVKLEMVNVSRLVDHVLNRFEMILDSDEQKNISSTQRELKNYRIVREIDDMDAFVEVDPDKLIQVLDNLMNNAIKYSPEGGKITVRVIHHTTRVIISISDEGLGIPRKDLANVFNRFFRVDKARSRAQGGTGLGLAISKEVIETFNGRIWVDSKENKGSTFYISLGLVEEDSWMDGDFDDE